MTDHGFHGADTAAMADLSGLIDNGAQALDAVLDTVDGVLRRIEGGCWIGPDADAFTASAQQAGAVLAQVRHEVAARGEEVAEHGREQEEASAPDADGGGAGVVRASSAAGASSGVLAASSAAGSAGVQGATGSPGAPSAAGATGSPGAPSAADAHAGAGSAGRSGSPADSGAPQMMVMDDGTRRRLNDLLRGAGLPQMPTSPTPSSREERLREAVRL
ncbi:WXG100 family type VII secretion target [Brachybacterium nesterenkovii]|uniref:WXG100 family type VII secretion target n=1 Tax=Brachybacterium nesterenkovii TaxID=47847 RepID=UPI00321A4035